MIYIYLTNVFMHKVFRFVNVSGYCTNKNGCFIWLLISVQHMEDSFLLENINSVSNGLIASNHKTATCWAYIKCFDIVSQFRYLLRNRPAGTILLKVLRTRYTQLNIPVKCRSLSRSLKQL